jgi:squalene synthase HpnC
VVAPDATTLERSYAACAALAQAHYENFPVASRLLPAALRPHVTAVYAFARVADDFADEPGREPAARLRLLDEWRTRLHQAPRPGGDVESAAASEELSGPVAPGTTSSPGALIFPALHDTIARFDLPLALFDDLLSAFRQDVTTTRYETWADVDDYCRRSANPVGRLVLRLARQHDEVRDGWSDEVCTALQLTNFWQDFGIDWARGRLYLPAEAWGAAGASPDELGGSRLPPAWREALRSAIARTRTRFARGRPVCDAVSGRLRYELRATWHGGMRILERLERGGCDPLAHRPSLGAADVMVIGWRTLAWSFQRPAQS